MSRLQVDELAPRQFNFVVFESFVALATETPGASDDRVAGFLDALRDVQKFAGSDLRSDRPSIRCCAAPKGAVAISPAVRALAHKLAFVAFILKRSRICSDRGITAAVSLSRRLFRQNRPQSCKCYCALSPHLTFCAAK